VTTQLDLYNDALGIIGERLLANLSEGTEPRRILDQVWPGARNYCLEHAHWKFAQRTSKISYTPSITPAFGFTRAFEKPTDLVKLSKLCGDAFFQMPLVQVVDENGFWFTDLDDIYVSYVSNDAAYGYDYSLWPETFSLFVSTYLATRIAPRLRPTIDTRSIVLQMNAAKEDAQAKDAVQGPTQFPPQGTWNRARRGSSSLGRQSTTSLYG
jgi:hypothetical protein